MAVPPPPSVHQMQVAFLWPDLGWLHLRLVPHVDGKTWQILADATSGPWAGTFVARTAPTRAHLAQWLADLDPGVAYALLASHPPMAAARAAL